MRVDELILYLGGIVGALATLAAGMWWLVWPRIEDKLQEVAQQLSGVQHQLTGDEPDSVSRHARVAARAAADISLLRGELGQLAERQSALYEWRRETDRRLGSVEEALLALLGRELRNRVIDDDRDRERPQHHHLHLDTSTTDERQNHDRDEQ